MAGVKLGDVFADSEVARLCLYRPPYPDAVFAILRRLLVEPRTVLDAGAGTGALARRMTAYAERVDAVDPSRAMVEAGRRVPGGADPRIRWTVGRLEDAPLSPPYGLITCGASLHWMDLDVALPRLRDALAPGAVLAIADTEYVHGAYADETRSVIERYSEIEHHTGTVELVRELQREGRIQVAGEERTGPEPFEQSVDEYIEHLHSTSTLARVRLGDRAAAFDDEIRAVFQRRGLERLRYGVVGIVIWGAPTG